MGILGTAIQWIKGLFGGSEAETEAADSATDDSGTPTQPTEPGTSKQPTESGTSKQPTESGTSTRPEDSDSRPVEDRPAYKCTVCGTTVDADAEQCPLCHSSDLVSVDEATTAGSTPEGTQSGKSTWEESSVPPVTETSADTTESTPDSADDDSTGLGPGSVTSERSEGSETNAATDRLRQAKARGQVLDVHDDKWAAQDDGYQVTLPEGVERTVDTKEEVRTLLWNAYGRDESGGDSDATEDSGSETDSDGTGPDSDGTGPDSDGTGTDSDRTGANSDGTGRSGDGDGGSQP